MLYVLPSLSLKDVELSEIITLFNFKNVINKPTRITAHSSTLLDHIIISVSMSSIYSDVLNVSSELSDHDAAVSYIECPNCTTSSFKREILLYDRIDEETFKQSYIRLIGMRFLAV